MHTQQSACNTLTLAIHTSIWLVHNQNEYLYFVFTHTKKKSHWLFFTVNRLLHKVHGRNYGLMPGLTVYECKLKRYKVRWDQVPAKWVGTVTLTALSTLVPFGLGASFVFSLVFKENKAKVRGGLVYLAWIFGQGGVSGCSTQDGGSY